MPYPSFCEVVVGSVSLQTHLESYLSYTSIFPLSTFRILKKVEILSKVVLLSSNEVLRYMSPAWLYITKVLSLSINDNFDPNLPDDSGR